MEDKIKRLEELKQKECVKCSPNGNMWCWDLPLCYCHVKSLREEIEGKCESQMCFSEYLDQLVI